MQKKGDSQLISWVLLVGFVIGLATMVTMWVKDRAEQTTQEEIDRTEQELRCAETAINVAIDCPTMPRDVQVTNTGKFTIQKLKFRQLEQTTLRIVIDDVVQVIPPQAPPQTVSLNTNIDPLQEFDIIPIIIINEKEVVCVTRKITHTC